MLSLMQRTCTYAVHTYDATWDLFPNDTRTGLNFRVASEYSADTNDSKNVLEIKIETKKTISFVNVHFQ